MHLACVAFGRLSLILDILQQLEDLGVYKFIESSSTGYNNHTTSNGKKNTKDFFDPQKHNHMDPKQNKSSRHGKVNSPKQMIDYR